MNKLFKEQILNILDELKSSNMYRRITQIEHNGKYINRPAGNRLLNLASNDYLGLLDNSEYNQRFWDKYMLPGKTFFGSGSSRLLTGDCGTARELEQKAEELFALAAEKATTDNLAAEKTTANNLVTSNPAAYNLTAESEERITCKETAKRDFGALVFNSGYHANTGIIGAVGTLNDTIFIADKLVHASIIDGLKLSGKRFERYRHNDTAHLQKLVETAKSDGYRNIVVITEAVFSMDGDTAPLNELVKIKHNNPNVILYVDEAHSFGLYGETGLGLCEHYSVIQDIDIIVAPLGKAASSVGALAVVDSYFKEFLINKMRTLIFSTALPQVNYARSCYFLSNLQNLEHEREHLQSIIKQFKAAIGLPASLTVETAIIPYKTESAEQAVEMQKLLEKNGILAPAIRPPTVPPNGSRLRLSITAAMSTMELDRVAEILKKTNRQNELLHTT